MEWIKDVCGLVDKYQPNNHGINHIDYELDENCPDYISNIINKVNKHKGMTYMWKLEDEYIDLQDGVIVTSNGVVISNVKDFYIKNNRAYVVKENGKVYASYNTFILDDGNIDRLVPEFSIH